MTFTSIGYAGQVSAANWAALAPSLGVQYSIGAMPGLRATVASGDRRITVASGQAYGHGIMDTFTAETKAFDTQASGVRYDTLVVRRHWANKATTLEVVKGTATRAIAAARQANPGVIDDQPIALIRITAGSTVPVIEADLRCFVHNGGALAMHDLALSYLNTRLGAHVRIGTDEWVMQTLNGTTWAWVKETTPSIESIPQPKTANLAGTRGARPLLIQAGTVVAKSTSAALVTLTWETPFPNGLASLQLQNGDSGAGRNAGLVPVGTAMTGSDPRRWGDRTGVIYRCVDLSNGALLPTFNHRCDWIAIGF